MTSVLKIAEFYTTLELEDSASAIVDIGRYDKHVHVASLQICSIQV